MCTGVAKVELSASPSKNTFAIYIPIFTNIYTHHMTQVRFFVFLPTYPSYTHTHTHNTHIHTQTHTSPTYNTHMHSTHTHTHIPTHTHITTYLHTHTCILPPHTHTLTSFLRWSLFLLSSSGLTFLQ